MVVIIEVPNYVVFLSVLSREEVARVKNEVSPQSARRSRMFEIFLVLNVLVPILILDNFLPGLSQQRLRLHTIVYVTFCTYVPR